MLLPGQHIAGLTDQSGSRMLQFVKLYRTRRGCLHSTRNPPILCISFRTNIPLSGYIFLVNILALTLKFSQVFSINYTALCLHWAGMEGLLQFFSPGKPRNWLACIAHTTCPYLTLVLHLYLLLLGLALELYLHLGILNRNSELF